MLDPVRVREALEFSDRFWDDYFDERQEAMGEILAAAREWLEGTDLGDELDVCVTHWTILTAHRKDPGALFGFKPCVGEGPHVRKRFIEAGLVGSE